MSMLAPRSGGPRTSTGSVVLVGIRSTPTTLVAEPVGPSTTPARTE